jgi:spore maturation protein CgeB
VGEDYVRTLCATDVNLGFLRRLNGDLHTDRTVEIPACGAFLLSERTEEQAQLFAEGVEADYFEGHTELLEKVQRHLADPLRREEIARAGHSRALASGYDHNTALRRIFAELGLQLPAAPSE